MTKAGWYLREWRTSRGIKVERFAEMLGTSPGQLSDIETGKRRWNRDWLERSADALGLDAGQLLRHPDSAAGPRPIRLIGKVAAGSEGHFEDDYGMGAGDAVDPFPADAIALVVEGDSMVPRFNPGEVLIFGAQHMDPSNLIGREIMARLDDGRKLIKVLRRGAAYGTWDLYSINSNHAPIENARLLWALPFLGLMTR